MKPYFSTILLGILLLVACTPTAIPTDTPTQPPISTPLSQGETIIVTSTSDSGPGSLRQALEDVGDYDTITFDPAVFPPDDTATIAVSTDLPGISVDNLTLDASNAGVILDGSQVLGDWNAGLQIVSGEENTIMGLQISHFPGPGIAISGYSKLNVIGGDRGVGNGPWGQGNLISQNVVGIDLATDGTTLNTITGNLIGIDLGGTETLGNEREGVLIWEGAHDNTIGPDNIIANNGKFGVYEDPSVSTQNTINQNSIFDNGIGRGEPAYPVIFDFDLAAGTATGATCPNCIVEIYSTSSIEGEILEDQTTADENGVFEFNKGDSFTGPILTVRTTNTYDRTSSFTWPPTSGTEQHLVVQEGNTLPRRQFFLQLSRGLADNHIAAQYDGISYSEDFTDLGIYRQGVTRARVSMAGLEPELVDWDKPEFSISQAQDDHFTRMADQDIIVTYVLMFWDKETYPGGEGAPCVRFKTKEEIEHWLEYVRFTVNHLKDRVKYFEIWNEPDIRNYCPKSIDLDDYINLVHRTVPVIREVAPEAKIVVGAISFTYYEQDYLFGLLESDVMPLVDVISWHPMYGTSPKYNKFRNYYNNYPAFVQRIKDTAAAHGFVGEYHADELAWRTEAGGGQEGVYSPIEVNKYFLRAAIMHRGMDIDIGLGSGYYIIHRLSTVMAGVEPAELPVEIQSPADNIVSYNFTVPDGGYMVGLWTNGIASEFDPGIEATVIIPGFSTGKVTGIDILHNLEQELIFEAVGGNLVIKNLLIKDYPILIKLIDAS